MSTTQTPETNCPTTCATSITSIFSLGVTIPSSFYSDGNNYAVQLAAYTDNTSNTYGVILYPIIYLTDTSSQSSLFTRVTSGINNYFQNNPIQTTDPTSTPAYSFIQDYNLLFSIAYYTLSVSTDYTLTMSINYGYSPSSSQPSWYTKAISGFTQPSTLIKYYTDAQSSPGSLSSSGFYFPSFYTDGSMSSLVLLNINTKYNSYSTGDITYQIYSYANGSVNTTSLSASTFSSSSDLYLVFYVSSTAISTTTPWPAIPIFASTELFSESTVTNGAYQAITSFLNTSSNIVIGIFPLVYNDINNITYTSINDTFTIMSLYQESVLVN